MSIVLARPVLPLPFDLLFLAAPEGVASKFNENRSPAGSTAIIHCTMEDQGEEGEKHHGNCLPSADGFVV